MKLTRHFIQHSAPSQRIISVLVLLWVSLKYCFTYVVYHSSSQYLRSNFFVSASKEEIELYCKACRILLSYLINRLQVQTSPVYSEANGGTLTSTLSIKQLLLPIRALSTATSQLQRTEQFALAALMKNANLPHHIKTSTFLIFVFELIREHSSMIGSYWTARIYVFIIWLYFVWSPIRYGRCERWK